MEQQNPKRPSVKLDDSKWTAYFIDPRPLPCSHQPETTIKERRDELTRKVRRMIKGYISNKKDLLEGMKTVDAVERLSVGYHFEQEIAMFMQLLNRTPVGDDDLSAVALRFRLLRQNHYNIPCDVLESFKDENGDFKDTLRSDVDALLNLYEAAHLGKCDEDLLSRAVVFTTDCLSSLAKGGQLSDPVLEKKVQHALTSPTQRRMKRLEARLYISIYEKDEESNHDILELAKLDFHMLQLMHRDEVKSISLWYKDLNPRSTLGEYIRERPVECYFWALGVFYEPQYAKARIMFAKLGMLFSLFDDTEFHNPNKKEWLGVEVKNVVLKWKLLFSEIENIIQGLKSRYSGQAMGENTNISVYEGLLLEVTRMLAQEKNEFEVSLKAFDHVVKPETCAHEILSLNWLYQQLLLGFYIWDVRLRHLLQYSKFNAASSDSSIHESILENELKNSKNINSTNDFDNSCGGIISDKGQLTENSVIKEHESHVCPDLDVRLSLSSPGEVDDSASCQVDTSVQNAKHICLEKSNALPVKNDEHPAPARGNEMYPVAMPSKCLPVLQNLLDFTSDDTGQWVWNRFSHLEMGYKKELQGGSLDKFHLINKHTPSFSSLTRFKYQMDLMHFIVGPGGNILSIAEEEISSMIAYALAISEQQGIYSEAAFVKDELAARRKLGKVAPSNLVRDASMLSSILSPNEPLGKDNNLSSNASPLSYEESTSGFYDSFLSALKDLHPEICLNNEKLALKSKYTVVSIYAKQFYDLRTICCPSELAYISSISRCKKWNAQGGKSKVFFAKSLDDRFIIKQIKKTEFDSFLKFGLEYFKHFGVSQVSSNPTCLAKILGIYQVKEIRNGKETRTNFMVIENLLFGRNILRRYDLKGALFARYVPDSKNPEKVLLDQNFIEDMRTMPIYIEGKTKNLMERAIWNDTSFLSRMNVMDYSLFVGVDKQKKELVFGIIDYLRQYTWDKQLESWVKTSLVVPKNLSPTVISPKEYKIRFRAFMSQYFLSVPDA